MTQAGAAAVQVILAATASSQHNELSILVVLSHEVLGGGGVVMHLLKKSFYIADPIVLLPYLTCFDHCSRSWGKPKSLSNAWRDLRDLEGLTS